MELDSCVNALNHQRALAPISAQPHRFPRCKAPADAHDVGVGQRSRPSASRSWIKRRISLNSRTASNACDGLSSRWPHENEHGLAYRTAFPL